MVIVIDRMTPYLVIFAPFFKIAFHGILFKSIGLKDVLGMVYILKYFLPHCDYLIEDLQWFWDGLEVGFLPNQYHI